MTRSPSVREVELRDRVEARDEQRVRGIVSSTSFFSAEEVDLAAELVRESTDRGADSGYRFLFLSSANEVRAYACYGLVPCTESSYDLYWIATHSEWQHRGFGRRLLEETERRVRTLGGTRIYVDTSSRPQYEPTRRFYARCGYSCIAELPHFYRPGDGKIVFCKTLDPGAARVEH